jgi:uncharacterized phage-like protein YoqJ
MLNNMKNNININKVNLMYKFLALAFAIFFAVEFAMFDIVEVMKNVLIAVALVATGAFAAMLKNNIALTGKENPAMGIERLACTARIFVASVIAAIFPVVTAQHAVEIHFIFGFIRSIVESVALQSKSFRVKMAKVIKARGRRMAKAKNWTVIRYQRWLVKWGMANKAKKAKMKKSNNSFVVKVSKMSREQRRRLAHQWRKKAGIKHVNKVVLPSDKKEPMFIYSEGSKIPGGRKSSPPAFIHVATTIAARKRNNNGGKNVKTGPAFNTRARILAQLDRKKNEKTRPQNEIKARIAARKAARRHVRANSPILAMIAAIAITGRDLADSLMGQSLTELLQGGPAFVIFGIIAVICGLALLNWANQEEKKGDNGDETGKFRLYSGPFVGQGENMEDDNTQTAKEVKMGMIENSNNVLRAILEKLTGVGNEMTSPMAKSDREVKTYGRTLDALGYEETALTILHKGFRKMVIRDLTDDDVRALEGKFIWKTENCMVIVRDSQQYEMPNECFTALMKAVVVAGQVPDSKKVVTLQEVNKYMGSLLWARASVVSIKLSEILVMSKAVSDLYDGTVYVSATFAAQAGWQGYAIRRILTAKGLVKGMVIVLPDTYFPAGISIIASEIKQHLSLRNDNGKAIVMQPQGDGHSGSARTLSMQLWAMIMGVFVGSKRFDAFASDSYKDAMNGLDKATEKMLDPAEEGEDGRDKLLAEAARQHGFNPVAAFRSYGMALAQGLTKAFNPKKVNLAPKSANGKVLAPEGYPMMIPWMALADAFTNAKQDVPAWMAEKLEVAIVIEKALMKRANGAIPVLVSNLKMLDAAKVNGIRQYVIAAIATRIPTGKTSGIEVLLFDADEFGTRPVDIGPGLVGRKSKDVEFWLFPNQETLAFKMASEGGDDDDLYKFLTGKLLEIARDGLVWRDSILEETSESKDKETKLRNFLKKFAAEMRIDKGKLTAMMDMPFAKKFAAGKVMVGWPSLLGVKKVSDGYRIEIEEVNEDAIFMTVNSRQDIEAQMDLFAKTMVANNDSPFSAAIGTVAQSHKFALGILAGHVVLPEHIRHIAKDWALFVVRTILLSDMVDACNKGKGYKKAAEALQELNWAWGWLCYQIAKVEDAKVVCPSQYLVSVPPMARDLFKARHAETYELDGKTRKPGSMLANLFSYHEKLGNAVEALATSQHDRMEFAATVSVMADAVSIPMGGAPSAQAFVAPIWKKVWSESGRLKTYLDGLQWLSERKEEGNDDVKANQRYMAELNDITVWAAHAEFDMTVLAALVDANPKASKAEIEAMFKIAKLAMIYVNGFKALHVPDNSIKIIMDKDGKFVASGGVAGYLLPTCGSSSCVGKDGEAEFVGGSEILIEWMMDPAVIAAVAARKAVDGDFKFVTFVMKTDAFGDVVNGKRPLLYTEDDFTGKTVMEILGMPGVYLAGNTDDEAHEMQSTFLAGIADDVKKKRKDTLVAMKRAIADAKARAAEAKTQNKHKLYAQLMQQAAEAQDKLTAFAASSFAELLGAFKIRSVEENVKGTAVVETIDTFLWQDAKKQAYAQYHNTFVIVKFESDSDPEGDKVEVVAPVEVVAAPVVPAVVAPIVAPVQKDKGDLLGRLNRIHNVKEPAVVATPAVTPVYRIAFTGHRPEKIGGYDESSPMRVAVKNAIADALKRAIAKHGESKEIIVVTGGALGVDTDAAREAYKLGLKFIVARPCSDHGENFKADAKVAYQKMLKIAHKVVLVNEQPYDLAGKADCLHARNRWMVDNCDAVVAIWDGSPSGTSNCVAYAKKANRPMIIINPNDLMGNEPTPPSDPKPAPETAPSVRSTTLGLPNRLADQVEVEAKLGLPEDGRSFTGEIQTPNGNTIASKYTRIVYGDHGPYIELDAASVDLSKWQIRQKGSQAWYDEARLDGVMLYIQNRDVSTLPNPPAGAKSTRNNRPEGYADYQPGMLYVDPFKVKIVPAATVSEVPAVKNERKDYPISGHTYREIFQENGKYSAELAEKFFDLDYVLDLRREPQNQHDNNAIALYAQRDKVGYVPKDLAKMLAPMIDANPRQKYNFQAVVTGWDSGYPRFALEFVTVHQGRKGKEDGRQYQYWAVDKNEAKDYGSFVDTAIVSLSTMISTKENPARWDEMKTQYSKVSGYWFDLCDGDTESHNKFFAWLENQGLTGINFLGGEDNKYVVTFGTKVIMSRKSNVG